jgi:hypothetical protein
MKQLLTKWLRIGYALSFMQESLVFTVYSESAYEARLAATNSAIAQAATITLFSTALACLFMEMFLLRRIAWRSFDTEYFLACIDEETPWIQARIFSALVQVAILYALDFQTEHTHLIFVLPLLQCCSLLLLAKNIRCNEAIWGLRYRDLLRVCWSQQRKVF